MGKGINALLRGEGVGGAVEAANEGFCDDYQNLVEERRGAGCVSFRRDLCIETAYPNGGAAVSPRPPRYYC